MPSDALAPLDLLFTLGVLVHNAEEALWLPRWSRSAGQRHRPVTAFQFRLAVAALSALLVVVVVLARAAGDGSVFAYLLAGYAFAMVLNVVFPHLLATVAMRSYMPGTATAMLFNAPLGILLLMQMLEQGSVQMAVLAWAAPLVALVLVGAIPVLFALAGRLERLPAPEP